ncbi:alpha/beta hydrolase [Beijerinckia indica]|uniref:Alpha/beta hydrolase fold-3 domain protein n=1 Tax=Beijerinckia indica subsp. indica (strain ATCC 9039 / DSM 1715 / NCIMB 8712) TaxID=395963 RepID=B2IDQ3_BEII9|nr:alpha/beta hydrolase [Beijerinckia indica]ACB95489.1 Alpha/beta hydrolase fold-3 domain protein [Beijerinckia indica subsp. indica ATCC 9039]
MKKIMLVSVTALSLVASSHKAPAEPQDTKKEVFAIREGMNNGNAGMEQGLAKHIPDGVASVLDEAYTQGDADARLDVFYPASLAQSGQALQTIVWLHGGGWVSGDKDYVAPYLQILAARGFTVVGLNYSLAPEHHYPAPLQQIDAALAYLQKNAARLHIDPNRFFLAGDSAGAQLAGQFGNIVTDPVYARDLGISPSIAPAQLRGVILMCGVYDPDSFDLKQAPEGHFAKILNAYFGTANAATDPRLAQFSVVRHVTPNFPPIFLSVGNGDRLAPQSQKLAQIAKGQGVSVDSLFFDTDHKPALPHEYQFNLDQEDGKTAFERLVTFLNASSHAQLNQ